jgi:hypothetical protein
MEDMVDEPVLKEKIHVLANILFIVPVIFLESDDPGNKIVVTFLVF